MQVLFTDAQKVEVLTRGEGQIVEPSSHSDKEEAVSFTARFQRDIHQAWLVQKDHERVLAEEEVLRQAVMEWRDMMKILMERNIMS